MRRHAKMEALRALLERRAMPQRVWNRSVPYVHEPMLNDDGTAYVCTKGGPLGVPFVVLGTRAYRALLRELGWEPPLILCPTYRHPKRKRSP